VVVENRSTNPTILRCLDNNHFLRNLQKIKQALVKLHRLHPQTKPYHIPRLWRNRPSSGDNRIVVVNPYRFYLDVIEQIEKATGGVVKRNDGGEWSREAVIYNMFVRTTCAFDHNQNGTLDLPANPDGYREVGTFLKAIALLPYIRRLGANTVHLLPVTSIGHDGRKGTLGSPYAIRNPYKLDGLQSEPVLDLDAETEFAAFVEAAHRLGIRVVVEFVFRTAAKDSDWIVEHPEWFYWIRADIPDREPSSSDESTYGRPLFTADELRSITAAVNQRRFDSLLPPHAVYTAMFTPPPKPETIRNESGRFIGYLDDGTPVRVPGAFADWPPDDVQPPWSDVTYLKLHNHPDFNYIAYNTVRMYDARLTPQFANHPLWEKIIDIIPHFQKTFGIDGVMIDMGHSLPMELKERMIQAARALDPDFAFWDENFTVTEKSRQEGYNAVIGYCWSDQHDLHKFRNLLRRFEHEGFPLPFFATPESHNTPRAAARPGGIAYSKAAWFVDNFIPAIPFIHSGFELGEVYPINTGLGFSLQDLKHFSNLPLFNEYAYDWLRAGEITQWVENISNLRRGFAELIINPDRSTFQLLDTTNENIIAFLRTSGKRNLWCIANYDFAHEQRGVLHVSNSSPVLKDLISGTVREAKESTLPLHLAPGECLLLVGD